jgi:alpha-amylase/alpha-mannosidase (GH57 family)
MRTTLLCSVALALALAVGACHKSPETLDYLEGDGAATGGGGTGAEGGGTGTGGGTGDGGGTGEEGGETGDATGADGETDPDGTATGGGDGSTTEGGDGSGDGGGTEGGDAVEPPPDLTAPEVVGAFSADGVTITVRFSEDVAPQTASDPSRFQIFGDDASQLQVTSATSAGVFSHLTLSGGTQVNPGVIYTVIVGDVEDLAGNVLNPQKNKATIKRTVYVAILWHQHQPLYYDAIKDELAGPWVRKHATKDYFDMAEVVRGYEDVHFTVNLTVVLLRQLEIYLERLGPYVDTEANTVDEAGFLAKYKGKTDPWIDLLLEDTPTPESATPGQIELLYDAPWSCVSTAEATMTFFPEYEELRDKNPKLLTQEDFLALKIYFELAWFDPDFLNGPVAMPDGTVVDLSDLVTKDGLGRFFLATPPSEEMANRLVAENYKVMANVIPIHQELRYDPSAHTGQIEIATTPFYHPILPLIYSTEEAKQGQPFDNLPWPPYAQEGDANAQVARAVAYFEELFGTPPHGMWPGEGSVSESVVKLFNQNDVQWIATGHSVLQKSQPPNQPDYYPYKVDSDTVQGDAGSTSDEVAILFRDTELSDKMGFKFQTYKGTDAANETLADVLAKAPSFGGKDRLVVIILDGENAWEQYKIEHDGKGFFHALYGKLDEAAQVGDIITVTPTEYIQGNPKRGVPPDLGLPRVGAAVRRELDRRHVLHLDRRVRGEPGVGLPGRRPRRPRQERHPPPRPVCQDADRRELLRLQGLEGVGPDLRGGGLGLVLVVRRGHDDPGQRRHAVRQGLPRAARRDVRLHERGAGARWQGAAARQGLRAHHPARAEGARGPVRHAAEARRRVLAERGRVVRRGRLLLRRRQRRRDQEPG